MSDVLSDYMIDQLAKQAIGDSPDAWSLSVGLYVNNVSPTYATVLSDLTECTAAGYSEQALSAGSWTGSTSAGVASYAYPAVTFTMTGSGGGQTIYGHFIKDTVTGELLRSQLWGTPFAIPSGGAVVTVTPAWSDEECP